MDHICPSCGAASFKDKTPGWCCDSGKTEVGAPETDTERDVVDINDGNEGIETRLNDPIDPNEQAINDILHSLKPGTSAE